MATMICRSARSRAAALRALSTCAVLALGGCATASYGTLDGVLKGERRASGAELEEVRVLRAGGSEPAVPGMPIRKGDRIVTGADTRAVIAFGEGWEVIVEPASELEVLNPSILLRLGQAILSRIGQAREALKAHTEYVVAAPEGTQFALDVRGEEAGIWVVEGRVRLEPKVGDWEPLVLGAMQHARTRGPERPRLTPLDPQRARELRRVVSLVRQRLTLRMPDLEGRPWEEAREVLRAAGLDVGRVNRVLTARAPAGTVVGQDPGAGVRVRAGRRVRLDVAEKAVRVPELSGLPLKRAQALLRRLGLEVSASGVRDARNEPGTVMGQSPLPGVLVRAGEVVRVTYAQPAVHVGPLDDAVVAPRACAVPDVRGLSPQQAEERLAAAGLRLKTEADANAQEPRQSPAPGSRVRCGSTVVLTLPYQIL